MNEQNTKSTASWVDIPMQMYLYGETRKGNFYFVFIF